MYQIQIKIDGKFKSIRPTGGEPYQFDVWLKAHQTLKMCYPDHVRGFYGLGLTRVIEVQGNE